MEKRALLEAFGDRISLPSLPEVVLRITAAIDDPACCGSRTLVSMA
jgi:HD-like signal output (HDOD) protein